MELFKDKTNRPSTITGFLGLSRPAHCQHISFYPLMYQCLTVSPWHDADVRMRYQNRTLRLPFCANPKDHYPGAPEMCSLEAFNRRIAELTPKDWAAECRPTHSIKARSKDL